MKLKSGNGSIRPFSGHSAILIKSPIPISEKSKSREWYLKNLGGTLPPFISSSEFVPKAMIEHLMRNKKDGALGVKFWPDSSPPDAITNMEGAMHTFVTAIVQAEMHGDYIYRAGHKIVRFSPREGFQQARTVVISAQIQPDFENDQVILALSSLQSRPIQGQKLPGDFRILSVEEKQTSTLREVYDSSLQRHMIFHLVRSHSLPGMEEVLSKSLTIINAITTLESFITDPSASIDVLEGTYLHLPHGEILSLELLSNLAIQQVHNELSALELLCPQGYIYTSDPASIFARQIGSTILNRLHFAALKALAAETAFRHMRVFAFNDYADPDALALLREALRVQSHLRIVPKRELFPAPEGAYVPLKGTEEALLVIHNNSDGFGQNVETEFEAGSLDGAVGANSSAAASLRRDRVDLVDFLI